MSNQSFSDELDFDLAVGPDEGSRAFFGQNVLQALIDGIADFVHERQPRWERRTHRVGAPVLLGCSPWVSDEKLLAMIEKLPGACIVISKQPRTAGGQARVERLRELNEQTSGIELRALSGLDDMAPKTDGQPRLIGPYETIHEQGESLSTFRTFGWRKVGRDRPPIAHAKLALLGNICWTDEGPIGDVVDHVWFSARRLWVSSANFTYASRSSVEFGYWTEDTDLVRAVEHFLVRLIGASEGIEAVADEPNPELARVEFDDEAMAEAAADSYQASVEEAALRGEELEDDDEW